MFIGAYPALNRNASVATPAECRRGVHEFLEIFAFVTA